MTRSRSGLSQNLKTTFLAHDGLSVSDAVGNRTDARLQLEHKTIVTIQKCETNGYLILMIIMYMYYDNCVINLVKSVQSMNSLQHNLLHIEDER